MHKIQKILKGRNEVLKKALFLFSRQSTDEEVLLKFNLWSRYFFPQYFSSSDAPFHREIDKLNLSAYRGDITSFTNVAFRGAAKSARTKLFIAFAIANDTDHFRRYVKVLSADNTNATQIVTDIYNMFMRCGGMYPELFQKTGEKREERMSSFTTTGGVKVLADTVGTDQRGAIQEERRPDLIWFEDFETRKTLRSLVTTQSIRDNMEEARTGLAQGGSCIYTCNYISEAGNVHIIINKESEKNKVLITPILRDGKPTWERYAAEEIEQMRKDDDDFEGERMCNPAASGDVVFNREAVNQQIARTPIREISGLKIFHDTHRDKRIAGGHDVAGGVGLDSSTSVFMDFDNYPVQVIATYKSNTVKPEAFGYAIIQQNAEVHTQLTAIESNNHGLTTITICKQQGVNQYTREGKQTKINEPKPMEYGWHTNGVTKPKMIQAFAKAVERGEVILNDKDLIAECRTYTRNDLIDSVKDPRLTTRHFDLLIAAAICWQMKDYVEVMDYTPTVQNVNFNFG
jgi:hypothetical protein